MVKIKLQIPGLDSYQPTSFMGDEEYSVYCAREFEKQNPEATAAQCLAAGRAALKKAKAEMNQEDVKKDEEMKAERERKEIAKIAEREAKKPETAKEKEARLQQETPPSEMDDTEFMRTQMEELHKRYPEWDMTHLIREARKATHKTAEARARNRREVPAAIAAKEARKQATTPATIPTDRALTNAETVRLGHQLNDLRILHPDKSTAELLRELNTTKDSKQ
jgi:Sec-independent protein translocase protein TatA